MSIRKRLRVILAALTQTWHERTCENPDCRATWWAYGEDNGLLQQCADCEAEDLDVFIAQIEHRHQLGTW